MKDAIKTIGNTTNTKTISSIKYQSTWRRTARTLSHSSYGLTSLQGKCSVILHHKAVLRYSVSLHQRMHLSATPSVSRYEKLGDRVIRLSGEGLRREVSWGYH